MKTKVEIKEYSVDMIEDIMLFFGLIYYAQAIAILDKLTKDE